MTGARRLRRRARPAAAASSCSRSTSASPSSSSEERLDAPARARRAARPARERRRAGSSCSSCRESDPPRGDDLPAQRLLPARTRSSSAADAATSTCVKGALLDEHYLENEVRIAAPRPTASNGRAARRRPSCATRSATTRRRPRGSQRAPRRQVARATAAATPVPARTPPMGRHPARPPRAAASTRSATDERRRRPRRVRHRPRRRRHLPARLPRRATRCRTGGCGSPTGSAPRADDPDTDAHDRRRRPSPTCAPTSTSVRDGFERFDLLDDRVRFLQGDLGATLPDAPIEHDRAAAHRPRARRRRSATCSTPLYDRLAVGGVRGRRRRARRRRAGRRSRRSAAGAASPTPLERVDWSGASLAQDGRGPPRPPAPSGTERTGAVRRPPLAPPAPTGAIDLSVVVVFYNMRREAARTLHSLSRAYQERHRRPRLRGHRRRERLRPRPAARRGVRRELRPRVPLPRPRRRRPRRRRCTRSTAASRVGAGRTRSR